MRAIISYTVLAIIAALASVARAEHLPVQTYTTADGLGNGRVFHGARDRRGFLWFSTPDGLSRFDGKHFETFGSADGLPDRLCYDVLQASDGTIWVATQRGLASLDPARSGARPRFEPLAFGTTSDDALVTAMFEDAHGDVWLGTEGGLWRIAHDRKSASRVDLRAGRQPFVYAFAEDRYGTLWMGTSSGLTRRLADGRVELYRFPPVEASDRRVMGLRFDHAGRLWVGAVELGIIALIPPPPGTRLVGENETLWDAGGRGGAASAADGTLRLPSAAGEIVRYSAGDGFPDKLGVRRGTYEDSRGDVWFGASSLVRFDSRRRRFEKLGSAQGMPEEFFAPCIEDAAGNMWFGGNTTGVVRVAPSGLVAFTLADGLAHTGVFSVVSDRAGTVYAITYAGHHFLHRFDGTRFEVVRPKYPTGVPELGAWGQNQIAFPDRDGRWWYATGHGVAHYPAVRFEDLGTTEPEFFRVTDGLPGRDILRLFGDSRDDVWITTMSDTGLARWRHATNTIEAITSLPGGLVGAYAEDASGAIWLGYDDGTLARLPNGSPDHAKVWPSTGDLAGRSIEALLFDRAGRLWIATGGAGVVRVDDPSGAATSRVRYTTRAGLATDVTSALVEDLFGRIYVGTIRGIDQIDVATGEIGHLSTADGLPNDYIFAAHRDVHGDLWFATHGGVARLHPGAATRTTAPPAYIVAVRVGGKPLPVAMGGARSVPTVTVAHDDGQLDLELTSPSFAIGNPVLFQVRLEGADDDWSAPSSTREVHYAHLAPGRYRFLVRSLYGGGLPSEPASLELVVLSPIWQRWWFIALVAAVLSFLGWLAYRRRVAHLLAVERVRFRIATDLHDDLGASLSRISILSEVASRRVGSAGNVTEIVDDIGRSARDLVDVASDIVWSTDPRRDDLGSLLVRLRSYAGDMLEARSVVWSLDAPIEPDRIKLGPDQRRHLYLVIKEAVNNAARHAGARRVAITVDRRAGGLEAIVEDDGCGIDASSRAGNGLANMKERATQARGTLLVDAPPGGGTRVTLRIPLRE